jgi:CubicO group peptidase (beta-lactamase class C family)
MKENKGFRRAALLLLVAVLTFLFSACGAPPEEIVETGDWPNRAWRKSAPEAHGVDSAGIADMLLSIRKGGYAVHGFMLIRNGTLVAEAYDAKSGRNARQEVYSITKSVTSALMGIAMDEGLVKGLDSTLGDCLGAQVSASPRSDITLREILTMSAGFPGIQTLPSFDIPEKPDALKFILDLPMGEEGRFVYNNACPHLVSVVIRAATGKNALEYAREKLFGKLGIDGKDWMADRAGNSVGGSGLQLTPFELSKLGYLYLNGGAWDGEQIVPKDWVEASTSKQIDTRDMNDAENYGYGYFWWMNAFGGYSAHGAGGQYLFVVPDLSLVAVFTASLDDADFAVPYRMMEQYVVPACKSKEPLPDNAEAAAKIGDAVKAFA